MAEISPTLSTFDALDLYAKSQRRKMSLCGRRLGTGLETGLGSGRACPDQRPLALVTTAWPGPLHVPCFLQPTKGTWNTRGSLWKHRCLTGYYLLTSDLQVGYIASIIFLFLSIVTFTFLGPLRFSLKRGRRCRECLSGALAVAPAPRARVCRTWPCTHQARGCELLARSYLVAQGRTSDERATGSKEDDR